MTFATILVLGGLRLLEPPLDMAQMRQQEFLLISEKVAGLGKPNCTAYHPDGSISLCLPRFSIRPGRQVNARAFGGRIEFSSAAVQRLSADQFALLAGHEIAHYYLGHTHSSIRNELEADALGALLACQAGFQLDRADVLFRFARSSRSHPPSRQRRKVLLNMAASPYCKARPGWDSPVQIAYKGL